jgi:hypothetical protein
MADGWLAKLYGACRSHDLEMSVICQVPLLSDNQPHAQRRISIISMRLSG